MAIASFDEENKLVQETQGTQSQHFLGMSGWLVRKGLASNQTSADLTLVVLSGLLVVFSFFLFFHFSGGSATLSEEALNAYIQNMRSTPPVPKGSTDMPH